MSIEQQVDTLRDKLRGMLLEGDAEGMEQYLRCCHIDKEPVEVLLAAASVTLPAHGKLAYRRRFMGLVKERMIADGLTADVINRELSGLWSMPMQLTDFQGWMRGEDVAVIGCGPSAGVPPISRELQDCYRSHWTMGVNSSVAFCEPDFVTCVEAFRCHVWNHICLASPIAIFWHLANDRKNKLPAKRMVQFDDKNMWQLLRPGTEGYLRVSQCPFYAAALCIYLGFERIGLIGVDLTDDRYPDPAKAIEGYGRLAAVAAELGSELVNLSPSSRLSSIPQADWGSIRRK